MKRLNKQDFSIGTQRYHLTHMASGGICHVYRAAPAHPNPSTQRNQHLQLDYNHSLIDDAAPAVDSEFAVKIVREEWQSKRNVHQQFERECQITRALKYPRLPNQVTEGRYLGHRYLAYQFIEGAPLLALLRLRRTFCKDALYQIVRQLLEQLYHLHENRNAIAHGDISIENIIISSKSQASIIDFGCAHFVRTASRENCCWLGKPSYLSPEQARKAMWSTPSDIYQMGVVFYELITTRRWNQGVDITDKTARAINTATPYPEFIANHVSTEMSAMVAAMLNKDPSCRSTARQCLQRLSACSVQKRRSG